MGARVINPGLSTTVQDLGRPGYFHLGIPIGGAMDRLAMRAANLLVGNDEGAAGLEAVFIGPQIEFTSDTVVAVTGADMPIKLDGEEKPGWTAFAVKRMCSANEHAQMKTSASPSRRPAPGPPERDSRNNPKAGPRTQRGRHGNHSRTTR